MNKGKWTENTVKSWLNKLPSKDEPRHIRQQDNLQSKVYASGKLSWFAYRSKMSDLFLGTYPSVTLKQAKALAQRDATDTFIGENPDGRLTFKEYCNSKKFVNETNKNRTSNFHSLQSLNNRICPVIGHIKMNKITLDDIDSFKYGYDAKPSSVNRLLNEIRAVLTHATKKKAIKHNIVIENLEVVSTPEKRYLQQSELDALRKACREPLQSISGKDYLKRGHLPLVVDVAVFCGCRLGEILKIRYSDINTWDESSDEAWQITLRAETTKSKKARDVHLPLFLKERLEKWWTDNLTEEEIEEVSKDRKSKRNPTLHNGKRLFPYSSIQTSFEKARDRAELSHDITFHSLRHHFCSNALIQGVPIHLVQMMAGHASITTTEKYLHVIPSDSAKHIKKYWQSIYRYEATKKAPKNKPLLEIKKDEKGNWITETPSISIPSLTQFDTDLLGFDVDEYLKSLPVQPIAFSSKYDVKGNLDIFVDD